MLNGYIFHWILLGYYWASGESYLSHLGDISNPIISGPLNYGSFAPCSCSSRMACLTKGLTEADRGSFFLFTFEPSNRVNARDSVFYFDFYLLFLPLALPEESISPVDIQSRRESFVKRQKTEPVNLVRFS